MVSLGALWLPIVLSAILVFFVSAAVWMAMPHHKKDFAKVDNEDAVLDALRENVRPGMYYFPFAVGSDLNTDEYKDKVRRGPTGILKVRSAEATLNMGPAMAKSLLLYLVVSIFVAYLASRTLPLGTEYMTVFQVTSTSAFMAYGFIGFQESIWFGLPGSVAFKHAVDGLVYALLTAGIFGWLWPM